MNGSTSGDSGGVVVGLAPVRLAVAPKRRLPESVADEAHQLVVTQALDWQQTAGAAVFWEMGAATQGTDEGRVYALAGLMASAGEQLALAHAGAVEVALWQEVREKTERDPADEMAMRGMAEAQCLFVIGTGHALANVVVRMLALSPNLRAELIKRFQRGSSLPSFEPFSMERDDWVSLNAETCRTIQAVARRSGAQEVIRLIEPVAAFGLGKPWGSLLERRGEDFHRWRPQTHGIEGVPRRSPWTRRGQTRVLTFEHPSYEEAQGLADEVARLASEAMTDLAQSMNDCMDRWPAASGHLGGPRFKVS